MKRNSKMIGIANIADIHFRDNIAERLYQELKVGFLDVLQDNIKDIHLINILGDLTHQKLLMTGNAAYYCSKFIHELLEIAGDKPVRIIVGTRTHDYNQPKFFRYLSRYCDLLIYDKPRIEQFDFYFKNSFTALYIPEEYPANWKEYYQDYLFNKEEKYDAIFIHGMVDFMAHPDLITESEDQIQSSVVFPEKIFEENAVVSVGGHVHVAERCNNFHYCGSFTRWCYGEEKPKGWVFLQYDLLNKEYSKEFVENELALKYDTIKLSKIYNSIRNPDTTIQKIKNYVITKKIYALRIKCDLETTPEIIELLRILRETFSKENSYKIDIMASRKITKNEIASTNTEEEKKESEIAYSQNSMEEKIQKWILLKNGTDVDLPLIRETIGNSKNS